MSYTPTEANYNGPDTFTYTITDNGTTNGVARLQDRHGHGHVTVTEVNDTPAAVTDTATVAEDSAVRTRSTSAHNDTKGPANECGQTLTITAVTQGAHGTVPSSTAGTVTLHARDANYNGPDTFTYTITDNGTTNGAADPKSTRAPSA